MTRRVVLGVAVLVVTVSCFTAAGAASAPYADPGTICEGETQQVAVLLENGDVVRDDLTVFAGTPARVVYCAADRAGNPAETTDAWGLESVDGVEILESSDRWIAIRATGPVDAIDLAELVTNKSAERTDAPTLTVVPTGHTETGHLDSHESVQFVEDANREAFRDASATYADAVADADALAAKFEAGADSDDLADAFNAADVEAVDERTATLRDASNRVEGALLRAAANGGEDAAGAYVAQRDHRTDAVATLEAGADAYVAAVESQARGARLVVTAALLGPFLGGVLGGAFLGRVVSRPDLKRVRRERRRDRTVDYSLANLWKVYVLAAVAVAVGAAVVAVGADLGRLVEVLT